MSRSRNKLNISCKDTDCNNGLHCFKATNEMVAINTVGRCRVCGSEFVDWKRVHLRDINDVQNTFNMLKHEKVRHFFWHITLTQNAINHARRKGKQGLYTTVRKRLSGLLGPEHPWHDGFQTPMAKNASTAIAYAQHATATCCRKCLEYWHGIKVGTPLDDNQIDYLTKIACLYIEDRIPQLSETGEKVPPIKSETE